MSTGIRQSVLITRPEEEGYQLADTIEAEGFHVICEPFLSVHHETPTVRKDLTAYAGVIITSANALSELEPLGFDKAKTAIYTVGEQTAQKARELGFENVMSAGGNVEDLILLMKQQDSARPYLYGRGRDISQDLSSLLPDYEIDELVLYYTKKITNISSLTREVMMRGEIGAILFFSARTAQAFREWVLNQPLRDNILAGLKRTRALCLGPSMVEYLSDMPWKDVQVANLPNKDALIALLMDETYG